MVMIGRESGGSRFRRREGDLFSLEMDRAAVRKTFLILEDDANDALLIRRAFTNSACWAFVCRNTSEARAYLQGAGMYADRSRFPFPDMYVTNLRSGDETAI